MILRLIARVLGTSATNWNTAADGSGSQVAWTDGDDTVFSANGTSTVSLGAVRSANSITVSGTGYTFDGTDFRYGLNVGTGSSEISAGAVMIQDSWTLGGPLLWSGGDVSVSNFSSVGGGGASNITLDGGSATWTQSGGLVGGGYSDWESGNIAFSGVTYYATYATLEGGSNTWVMDSGSFFSVSYTNWLSGDISVDNHFKINGTYSTMNFEGGNSTFTIAGTYEYAAGTINWTSGNIVLNNAVLESTGSPYTLTVPAGAELDVNGTFSVSNASVVNNGTVGWNSSDSMAGITNNATLNFEGTDTSGLPDLTNDGTVVFTDSSVQLVTLTGDSTATEGSMYTLNLGAVSSDVPGTVDNYIVDWGDNVGINSYGSGGDVTYTYGGGTSDSTTYNIQVHLETDDGVFVGAANQTVTVANAVQAPTGLSATAQGLDGVHLAWTDNSTGETSYEVQIEWPGTNFVTVAALAANTTSYQYADMPTENMTFRVRAIGAGESAYSSEVTCYADTSFMGTGGVTLTATYPDGGGVHFSWSQPDDAISAGLMIRKIGDSAGERQWYTALFTDAGIEPGATTADLPWDFADYPGGFQAAVLVEDSDGGYVISNLLTLGPPSGVAAPSDLSVTVNDDGTYTFSWTSSPAGTTDTVIDYGTPYRDTAVTGQVLTYSGAGIANGTPVDPAGLHTDSEMNSGYYAMASSNSSGYGVSSTTLDLAIPGAPTNIAAAALGAVGIGVTWTDNAFNESGFTIQRSSDGGSTWTTLSSTLAADTEYYQDTTAVAGTDYTYRVDSTGTNALGAVASAWDPSAVATAPAAKVTFTPGKLPTGVTWNASTNTLTLPNSTSATSFQLTVSGGVISAANMPTFTTDPHINTSFSNASAYAGGATGTFEIAAGATNSTITCVVDGKAVGTITLVVSH